MFNYASRNQAEDPVPAGNQQPPIGNVHIAGPAIIPAGNQPPIRNVHIAAAEVVDADSASEDNEGAAVARRLAMIQ